VNFAQQVVALTAFTIVLFLPFAGLAYIAHLRFLETGKERFAEKRNFVIIVGGFTTFHPYSTALQAMLGLPTQCALWLNIALAACAYAVYLQCRMRKASKSDEYSAIFLNAPLRKQQQFALLLAGFAGCTWLLLLPSFQNG